MEHTRAQDEATVKDAVLLNEAERNVRRWLECSRDTQSALFTIGIGVQLLYGKPLSNSGNSERGLVDYALRFANNRADRSRMRRYLKSGARIESLTGWTMNPAHVVLAKERGAWPGQDVAGAQRADMRLKEGLRAQLREFLAEVVTNKAAAVRKFAGGAAEQLQYVWSLPVLKRTQHGIGLRHHTLLTNALSFLACVSMLLVDEAHTFGRDLRQCRLKECGNFFITEPRKGRSRNYCCKDHMKKAHNLGAAERMRRKRGMKGGDRNVSHR